MLTWVHKASCAGIPSLRGHVVQNTIHQIIANQLYIIIVDIKLLIVRSKLGVSITGKTKSF